MKPQNNAVIKKKSILENINENNDLELANDGKLISPNLN